MHALLKMLWLGVEKMPLSVAVTHHLEFFFQAKGDFYRAEGEKVEARVGKSLQEK